MATKRKMVSPNRRIPRIPKDLNSIIVGGKGQGKSMGSAAVVGAMMKEYVNPATMILSASELSNIFNPQTASGQTYTPTTGSSTTGYYPPQEYWGGGGWQVGGSGQSGPKQEPEPPKKQEFNPDDHKGKFCAVADIIFMGISHTGVLFVKKCGHWKLLDFNGNKLAGGTAGSFDGLIKKGQLNVTVQKTLYDVNNVPHPQKELDIDYDLEDLL